jgi:hypothetical protein
MNYSPKKAAKHSFMGVAFAAIPIVVTWAVARNWLVPADVNMVTGLIGLLSSAFGAEFAAFKGNFK